MVSHKGKVMQLKDLQPTLGHGPSDSTSSNYD